MARPQIRSVVGVLSILLPWALAPVGGLGALDAQITPSPLGSSTQNVSGTEISFEHYRVSVRGRQVNGDLVPHGEFWTPSANYTTKIRFSKDVTFGGEQVAAGAYGLWVEGSDSTMWRAMLIADTTKGHGPHLYPEDGLVVVPAAHEVVDVFQETILLQLDSVRPSGALLRMHWGNDRISIPVKVEVDLTLTVEEEAARPHLGPWIVQRAPPSEAQIAEWRATVPEDEVEAFEAWLAETIEPREFELEWEDGMLITERFEYDDATALTVLAPRGAGFFRSTFLVNGEIWYQDDQVYEFFYDDDGRAIRAELWGDDGLQESWTRPESGG